MPVRFPLLALIISFWISFVLAQESQHLMNLSHINQNFAFELLRDMNVEGHENMLFSPYSISLAFAMSYAGAAAETAQEMEEVFGFYPEVARDFRLLGDSLNQPLEVSALYSANALWLQKDFKVQEAFLNTLLDQYQSELFEADFKTQAEVERGRIHAWVGEKTHEHITEILPEGVLDEYSRLVLTNALYISSPWQRPFNEQQSAEGMFTGLDGQDYPVRMMRQSGRFNYAKMAFERGSYEVLELPYGDDSLSFLGILPQTATFEATLAQLSPEALARALNMMAPSPIILSLPKFKLAQSLDLKALRRLGLKLAFEEFTPAELCDKGIEPSQAAADFSKIDASRCLYISAALHQATLSVDEKGSEATAASAVVIALSRSALLPSIELSFNRPFIFAIYHKPSQSILFLGQYLKP
ncbi:MAG: serpin family protein [Deinococcales bacterium]